ncbi:SHOCT domain-containing protein [Halorussus lipolyticus]|uniref:SHOCT domain-containing protein n=1 Tax=Halorussus lipolyticus TaxID=3034024 RepID=UPI0023E7910C|nr:SHOCT domain-containing protein [Halorussus sp. DT80]
MTGSRDTPSTVRSLHRLVEHYTPDGTVGRLLLGAPAITVSPFLFFGGIAGLGSTLNVAGFVLSLFGVVLGIPVFLLGLVTLWPVYLSLIGNVESPEEYPEGAADPESATKSGTGRETPEEVLKRRYAAGGLTREEFERRLGDVMDPAEATAEEAAKGDRTRTETSVSR